MIIKQYHRKEILVLVSAESLLILMFIGSLIYGSMYNLNLNILIIIIIISQITFTYFFAYELRTYIINDIGVTIRWMGPFESNIKWTKVISICYETVKLRSIEHNSIVVTKIPLKRINVSFGANSYYSAVDYDWLQMRPGKVIAIYLDDLKPGQHEEFWSYVPERLKGGFKPEEQ